MRNDIPILWSFVCMSPAIAMILYCMYKDVEEYIWLKKINSKKIENLLTETIIIALSTNEKKMLNRLSKIEGTSTDAQCLRKMIGNEISEADETEYI